MKVLKFQPKEDKAVTRVTDSVFYVGVNDHKIDLFEGMYDVPNGMAYNSYVVMDEKISVFDSVDGAFGEEWLENIAGVLSGREPDYLIVQHMEPDHSANIERFIKTYPNARIVGNAKTFAMLGQFFATDFTPYQLVVADGDTLCTGKHTFTFVFAPMVHWPEVMVTYDSADKLLFSADGFGKFGALDVEEDWACEARRYYFGIVGKYGMQVQNLLKKAKELPIEKILPLHGPVLTENLSYYLGLYDTWSSYGVESEGVVVAYTSVYGNTRKAAELLAEKLKEKGCPKVVLTDLARSDMAENVEDAFRYGKLVLATTTYNGTLFPFMREFIENLTERGYRGRTVGIIENGTWAPVAAKLIKDRFAQSKDITFTETTVTIRSAMKEQNVTEIEKLAAELC
ncbi:MAG: FprA family A-type flavoprotein [Lachnospiraceae bacterium]